MKAAVRYFSRTGNSKKLAAAIAEALDTVALDVTNPLEDNTEYVFLCNAMYAAGIDGAVKSFIKNNADKIGCLCNVSSTAVAESTYKLIKKEADAVGVRMNLNDFHCKGAFTVLHKGKPDASDLAAAVSYAKSIVNE